MKKAKKLLAVLLALVMMLSAFSVAASAYTVSYKTSTDVKAFNGYNSIDTVTRIPIDARCDMILDWLDEMLAGKGIYMDISPIGVLDAHSIDSTLDSLVGIRTGTIFGIAAGLNMIGDVELLNVDAIKTYRRTSADTGSDYVIASIFEMLGNSNNITLIKKVVDGSVKFGNIIGQLVGPYESYIRDIPGLLKGFILPLFQRIDDDMDQVNTLASSSSSMDTVLTSFVQGLFTKPQSKTTYKEDASGNCISGHILPTASSGLRSYYVKDGNSFTCYVYDTKDGAYVAETGTFDRVEETDAEGKGTGVYVYKNADGDNLKYYKDGSYWLPSLQASGNAATIMDISSRTPVQMLYDMIPYVFSDMAPVVLNGSVKKLLGKWFGATYNYVGKVGSAEVAALPDSSNAFFTQPQGSYLWEWSDYAVINGNHYYRFQDDIYSADLSGTNDFFTMINFDYHIGADFINEFIPKTTTSSSDTILSKANNFIGKVYNEVFKTDVVKYTWVNGDNSKLLDNIRGAFIAILNINAYSAEQILQGIYNKEVVDIIKDTSVPNTRVLAVLLAFLADKLMPQLILPSYSDISSLGQVGAIVVRELATQLIPGNDFDALIYTDYNSKTLASHTDAEWLDIILTMGSQIGVFYLNNLCDLELTDPNLGGYVESKTWKASDLTVGGYPAWEATVDFIIDWALEDDNGATGAWRMSNIVTTSGLTIDRKSVQDPWVKLDTILRSLLPVTEILNIQTTDYETVLEQALRGNFVDAVFALDVNKLVGMFAIPDNSVLRTTAVIPCVLYVVRKLINNIGQFGDTTLGNVVADSYTTIDSVLSKAGLSDLAGQLLTRLSAKRSNLISAIVPILNYFLGWSVNDQYYSPATLSTPRYSFNSQAKNTVNTSITIKNNSNGMERQYASGGAYAYDTNYKIRVVSATASVSGVTLTIPSEDIPAGVSVSIPVSGTLNASTPVLYTIKYQVLNARGELLDNGDLYTVYGYSYLSTTDSEENNERGVHKTGTPGVKRDAHKEYIFTKDVYSSVKNTVTGFQNMFTTGAVTLNAVGTDTAPVGDAAKYFRHATLNEVKAEMPSISKCEFVLSVAGMGNPGNAHLWYVKDGVNAEDIPYGYYDMGQISVTLRRNSNNKLVDLQKFVYYTDYGLEDLVNECVGYNITEDRIDLSNPDAQAAWNEYQAALLEAAGLIKMPYVAATMVSDWMPKAQASVDRLTAAAEAIGKFYTTADITPLTNVYEQTMDVNYQNVPFYRYSKFEAAQRAADSIIIGQTAPKAPEKYIYSEPFSAEQIDDILAAETDPFVKGLIENTVQDPDMTAYNEAMKSWEPASLTDLDVAIAAENLQLSYDRILDKADYKGFLTKEIAAAKANVTDPSIYTAKSWARYEAALSAAETLKADARNKEIFDAKYELMAARKGLVKTADTLDAAGKTAELKELYALAQTMLANNTYYAPVASFEGTATDAWSQLLVATGYESKAAETLGDQVYSGSAKYYLDKDLANNLYYTQKVDACASRLRAAINNLECAIKLVEKDATTTVDQAIRIINGINPGSIADMDALLAHVQASDPSATLAPTASKANAFGTGAKVDVNVAGIGTLTTYYVLIYGDVTGDGAVDGFDAIEASLAAAGTVTLDGVYETAADVNQADGVTSADYSALCGVATGLNAIDQKTGTLS